jgi:hypothetical protein
MNDLEQAIGEKCARVLSPHKTVVNEAEVAKIIEEMGPVETAEDKAAGPAPEGAADQSAPYMGPQPRKRLFNIREGAMWAGVCNGIAAYINKWMSPGCASHSLVTIFSWGGMSSCTSRWRSSCPRRKPPRTAPPHSACPSTPKS